MIWPRLKNRRRAAVRSPNVCCASNRWPRSLFSRRPRWKGLGWADGEKGNEARTCRDRGPPEPISRRRTQPVRRRIDARSEAASTGSSRDRGRRAAPGAGPGEPYGRPSQNGLLRKKRRTQLPWPSPVKHPPQSRYRSPCSQCATRTVNQTGNSRVQSATGGVRTFTVRN